MPVCPGNLEVWDQTVGCPECNRELWNYPDKLVDKFGEESDESYEERFFADHPFAFGACHDPGDEDVDAWEEHVPIGGFTASYHRYHYGNNLSRRTP